MWSDHFFTIGQFWVHLVNGLLQIFQLVTIFIQISFLVMQQVLVTEKDTPATDHNHYQNANIHVQNMDDGILW